MRQRGPSALALLVVTALLLAPPARGGEEAAWTQHVLGDGPASISLPSRWTTARDPDGFWLYAEDPADASTLFAWSRTPLTKDATLGRFYAQQLDAERGASIKQVGFRVDDVAYEPLAGKQAIWTLVQRPGEEPPTRSLYVHLRHAGQGHTLRVDVLLGTFDQRRALVRRLLTTFHLGSDTRIKDALHAIRARMAKSPPKTREDFRSWMEELRLLGEGAAPELREVVRRYVDGPGAEDDVARAFLGQRRFEHLIPEAVAFRGHPFLETVERANEKRWFGPAETAAYDAALEAWKQTVRHHLRLAQDRTYRAADQTFANLAHDATLAKLDLTFHWMDPYVLCGVSDGSRESGAVRGELEARGRILRGVYQHLLGRYGDALGLKILMAPWGGRPDLGPHRSFEDGAPLVVLVFDGPETWKRFQALGRHLPPAVTPENHYDRSTGRLELIGSQSEISDAMGGAYQLLDWFARQKRRWGRPRRVTPFLVDGLAAWLAEAPHGRNRRLLEDMRVMAAAYAKRSQPYPILKIERSLGSRTISEAVTELRRERGLTASEGVHLHRQQAWAFVQYLHEVYPDRLREIVGAFLGGDLTDGSVATQVARILRLRDGEDRNALQQEFERFVQGDLLQPDAADLKIRLGPKRLAVLYLRAAAGEGPYLRLGAYYPSSEPDRPTLRAVLARIVAWRPDPTLVLEADRSTPWARVQELMRVASASDVGITSIRFTPTDEPFAEDPDATPPEPLAVRLERQHHGAATVTAVSFQSRTKRRLLLSETTKDSLEAAARALGLAGSEQGVFLTVDGTHGAVPWPDVRRVLEALRDAGGDPLVQVVIKNAPR